ncbi:MAG TPA: glycosyltransferase family 39 protein [Terriglobales bacterium]|nr:glycosyltransferase family 39 protein [Terriglobales bacterium]
MNSSTTLKERVDTAIAPAEAVRSRRALLLPMCLLFIYMAQCTVFIYTQSLTFDEPIHIFTGWEMWRNGRFQYWNDHPPLSRLLCTLPILSQKWQMDVAGRFPFFEAKRFYPDPETMAHRGRAVNVVLGLILALLLWTTARRLFSEPAANLALALLAFSPALITHFSLITTDGAGVLFIFATAIQLVRWAQNPTRGQTALLGLVMGFLLLAKFYTPPMFLLALAWILILQPTGAVADPREWNWRSAVAVCGIAFLLLWAGYFFHVSHLTMRQGQMIATFPNREPIIKKMRTPVSFSIPVPAGEYFEGLRSVAFHNHRGHQSFFLGTASKVGGWKSYYPAVIVLKWPTMVLVLFATLLLLTLRGRVNLPREQLIMASFPAVFLVFAVFSKIDIGDRHVLPLYPFVLLFLAGWWQLMRRSRVVMVVLLAAITLNAVDALRYAPDYLAYFTPLVSAKESYKFLSDSNLDWGQGLLALRKYENQHPHEQIYLAYFGSVDPAAYGLRSRPLLENQRVAGATVIVSATSLTGQMLENFSSYRWVLQYRQKALLDNSLHVFEIPPAPIPPKTANFAAGTGHCCVTSASVGSRTAKARLR